MAASLLFGQAAQNGLRAALLASKGFTCTVDAIERRYGFLEVFAKKGNLAALIDGLGEAFEMMAVTYKPFPCGLVIHPSIDAMLKVGDRENIDEADIKEIRLRVSPTARALANRPDPSDDLEAKVSLQHWVAAAAARRQAGLGEGTMAAVNDPRIRRLRGLVSLEADSSLSNDSALVMVELNDGTLHTEFVAHCAGSERCPMSDEELNAKFVGQAGLVNRRRTSGRRGGKLLGHHIEQECWRRSALGALTLKRLDAA